MEVRILKENATRIRGSLSLLVLGTTLTCASSALPQQSVQQPSNGSLVFTGEDLMASVVTLTAPDMQGRRTGTPGNALARAWILEQLKSAGLAPLRDTFELRFDVQPHRPQDVPPDGGKLEGINIAAVCHGTASGERRALVITAHYDHLGVRDGAVYHGADDNASGVAVLLALARQCSAARWLHDAIFVAVDAEEMRLQGAYAFVAALTGAERERIALNINLDMVARGDKRELYMAGAHHRPWLRPILEPIVGRSAIKVLFGHDSGGGRDDWTTQSDHHAFHQAGIPFLYFGVEDHPDYHRPTDTADRITAAIFLDSAVAILDAVTTIDRALPPN